MLTSEFIYDENLVDNKELLHKDGATSLSYKVRIEGKQYFMKQLRPELYNELRNRLIFHKEFELGTSINSDYVVKYEKICEDENGLYILMEYIYGTSIEEKLKNEKGYFLNEDNVWRLLLQLLEGLKAFHAKGIAYLDISPNNIMLTQVGNNVKIIDLGFCFNNAYGYTAGTTSGFAAPELKGKRLEDIDERSDIYAVGCLMRYIQENSDRKYSKSFQKTMYRCLNEEKERRFSSTDEMVRAIRSRNRKRNISVIASIVAIIGIALFGQQQTTVTVTDTDKETVHIDTVTTGRINYRILSREEKTCEVIGGEGDKWNIYIAAAVEISGTTYRTVKIAGDAFTEKPIKSVYFPEGIETVSSGAFAKCDSVVSIFLPKSIRNISGAFSDMKGLKTLRIPPEIGTIQSVAFVGCTSLKSLDIPEGIERIGLDAFAKCTGIKEVSLPSTLKFIERGVFFECTGLESITIPASVEEIGEYAFYGCDSLRHVNNHATKPQDITTIFNTPGITVHVPSVAIDTYKNDINWKKYKLVGDL